MLAPTPSDAACPPEGDWLAASFEGEGWSGEKRRLSVEHLGASFREHALAVCDEGARADEPLARVRVMVQGSTATVTVADEVTNKRSERAVDLTGYADEAQALAVAVAADELLRASWAEVALERSAPQRPAPTPVAAVVSDSLPVAKRAGPRAEVWVSGAIEGYSGGQTLFGPELRARSWLTRHLALAVGGGPRWSIERTWGASAVRSRVLAGQLSLLIGTDAARTLGVHAGPALRAGEVTLTGSTEDPELVARERSLPLVVALLETGATWRPLRWLGLSAEGGVGLPLLAARARVDGDAVTGLTGVALQGALGVAAVLP